MFLLFIRRSYDGQLREGLIQLLIVCSGDTEKIRNIKLKVNLHFVTGI